MEGKRKIMIELINVNKVFRIREYFTIRERFFNIFKPGKKKIIYALSNVTVRIRKGEFFGIIGSNGSGKSTLINIMTGAYPPDKGGTAKINGKYMRLSLGMGFNGKLTARQNIYINASILGLTFKEIDNKFIEIIKFAELEKFADTQIKYFSSGMRARLSFAIAIHAEADIFLMDEFFGGVGDQRFRKKADEVFKKSLIDGRTIVHVSHNLNTVEKYCDRVLLLDKGKVIGIGKPKKIIQKYNQLMKN